MKLSHTFTDLAEAHSFYRSMSYAGYACTLQTVVPCKSWKVSIIIAD